MATIKNMGVDGDRLEGFVSVDANEVFVPDGRFRPLNEAKVKEIAESIEKHGQMQPILIDEVGNLIFGNHRLHACIKLNIPVEAKVTSEKDPNKLALIEIDENLIRKELTQTEHENHLAERKRLYNLLYPDTAKRGKKGADDSGKKSFSADTADTLGISEKSVDRLVKRGALASEEIQEARDNKEITNSDLDKIIAETGEDKEAQHAKLKEIIQAKAEAKNLKESKNKEEVQEQQVEAKVEQDDNEAKKFEDTIISLESKIDELESSLSELEVKLEKAEASKKRLQDRIAKAKIANPDIKI